MMNFKRKEHRRMQEILTNGGEADCSQGRRQSNGYSQYNSETQQYRELHFGFCAWEKTMHVLYNLCGFLVRGINYYKKDNIRSISSKWNLWKWSGFDRFQKVAEKTDHPDVPFPLSCSDHENSTYLFDSPNATGWSARAAAAYISSSGITWRTGRYLGL